MRKYEYTNLGKTWSYESTKFYEKFSIPALTLAQWQKANSCGFKSMLQGREIPAISMTGSNIVNNFVNYTDVSKAESVENYESKITMPFDQWQEFVAKGGNTMYLPGGIIPSGTEQTAGGNSGAVYKGHVRQGYGGWY